MPIPRPLPSPKESTSPTSNGTAWDTRDIWKSERTIAEPEEEANHAVVVQTSAFSGLLDTLAKVHEEEIACLRRELARLGGAQAAASAAAAGEAVAASAAEAMVSAIWRRPGASDPTGTSTQLGQVEEGVEEEEEEDPYYGEVAVEESMTAVAEAEEEEEEEMDAENAVVVTGVSTGLMVDRESGQAPVHAEGGARATGAAAKSGLTQRVSFDGSSNSPTRKTLANSASSFGKALSKNRIPEGWHQMMHEQRSVMATSWGMEVSTTVLVLLNALAIGGFAEYTANNGSEHPAESYVNTAFTVLFVVELIMRMCIERRKFLLPPNNYWNFFDTIVVTVSVVEQILDGLLRFIRIKELSLLRLLRILRLIRLARIIRVVRSTAMFRDPRLIILSLVRGAGMLLWVIIFHAAMFYVFGVMLLMGAVDVCMGDLWDDAKPLCSKFGTISRAMMSLFQAISGGVLWADLLEILRELDTIYRITFLGYLAISLVIIGNFATALLSKVVVDAAAQQSDDRVGDLIKDKEGFIRRMADVFRDLDTDGSGSVSIVELELALYDPTFDATLASLGLEIADVEGLFDLLDFDGNGAVEIDEFILGCLRLRGAARNIDLVRLQHTLETVISGMGMLNASVEAIVDTVEEGADGMLGAMVNTASSLMLNKKSRRPSRAAAYPPMLGMAKSGKSPRSNSRMFDEDPEAADFEVPNKPTHRRYINRPEERAMNLGELRRIGRLIHIRCVREHWRDMKTGEKLKPEDVNLYHLNYHVICPVTLPKSVLLKGMPAVPRVAVVGQRIRQADPGGRALVMGQPQPDVLEIMVTRGRFMPGSPIQVDGVDCGCPREVVCPGAMSYKETISTRPMKPTWYCCHWWGESVLDFLACVEAQSKLRNIREEQASYWVCAYANRQHDLSDEIGVDPDKSSFRRAMRVSEGTLLILDPCATPFKRIWCDFELFKTIHSDGKPLDIVTVHKGTAQLLSDDAKPLPHESALAKTIREQTFPLALLQEGFRSRLEQGDASVQQDKELILSSMASTAPKNLGHSEGLAYVLRQANAALHGRLARAAWPQAVKKGMVQDFDQEHPGTMQLPEILSQDDLRTHLQLSLAHFREVNDIEVRLLARGLPPKLTDLRLNFAGCTNVSDVGISDLATRLPGTLQHLHLSFVGCTRVSDEGVAALASRLPKELQHLRLDFAKCAGITEESVRVLAQGLPPRLQHLFVTLRGTLVDRDFKSKNELLNKAKMRGGGNGLLSAGMGIMGRSGLVADE